MKASRAIVIKLIALMFIFGVLPISIPANDDPPTSAGTVITNRADATYQDGDGNSYDTVSETVKVIVLAVPSITVTPDETEPSANVAPNEQVTRLFRICNTGNVADQFLLTRAEVSAPAGIVNVYFDVDNSGTVTPADVLAQTNQTLTPRLLAKDCIGVLVVFDTNNAAPQSRLTIGITARSNTAALNGSFPTDIGTIINAVGDGVRFTAPTNTSLPPLKLVENLPRFTGATGQTLNYNISFRNAGSITARQVRVIDELPAQLEYVSGSLFLNDRLLTDAADADEGNATARRFEILIGELAADAVVVIRFQARLIGANLNGAGVVNTAQISAANAPAITSSPAVVVVNPVGTVYAAHSGGAARISGATVTVAVDDSGTPLALTPQIGYAPNAENVNPFVTDANGGFSFALNENQIGALNAPVRYVVLVTAANYQPRRIEAVVRPIGNGFFEAQIRALDASPIAVADGFALTSETVQLSSLAAFVFNIPMFETSALEVNKTADKQAAEIGDIISYRVTVRNASASPVSNVVVRDTLPPSFVYAPGTGKLESGANSVSIEPEIKGSEMIFSIGDLAAGASTTLSYRVRIGANAREGEQFNSAVASGVRLDGNPLTTAPARVGVRVRAGIFSLQQIVIGRVFEDKNGNGKFDAGERPVAGARIYLNNGQSVITDTAGQYNLPSVSSGSLVLSLDPLTVPENYQMLNDDGRKSSKSWTRLLRTPLGGGAMLRQNFAVAPSAPEFAVSDKVKVIAAGGGSVPDTIKIANEAGKSTERKDTPVQIASSGRYVPPAPEKDDKSTATYTTESTETVAAVAPGKVQILSPAAEQVIMSPALDVVTRVAENWTVEAEINGEKIPASSIGETRVDKKNQVSTFSFVGVNVRPGANVLRVTAIGENGERGTTSEIKVMGRGAATRIEIVPAKTEVQAGGRETLNVQIRAFDQWGNPAADGQVAIETSAGRFVGANKNSPDAKTSTEIGKNSNDNQTIENENSAAQRQQIVSLVGGVATVQLLGDTSADTANLRAVAGDHEANAKIRFTPELRPAIMVGLAEYSVGRAAPEIAASGDDTNTRGRLAFYYRGRIFNTNNLLTLAYDSSKALNRTAGRDRFGELDPLDRAYPIFGDSSIRFEDAQSNSKLYARLDRNRSYAMFGDMETDMNELALTGYSRRLTGVKLHLENAKGDFVSVTGARPDTAFARDVIPGGALSLLRLSHSQILTGSEQVVLETRDRRNPEIIIRRENLVRGIDYNLNALTGEIFFLRPIAAFDYQLNLQQVVVAYEHRGANSTNYVYTGRAQQHFNRLGLRFGASYVNQQQGEIGAFQLGGFDFEKKLARGGRLMFETAMSRGRYAAGVGVFDSSTGGFSTFNEMSRERNGVAMKLSLEQPLPFYQAMLRGEFARSTQDFYNPFGATITPGAQRVSVALDLRPTASRTFTFGFMDERNSTRNVSNGRQTFSFLWSEKWNDKLRTAVGFDRRHFSDDLTEKTTDSNLITAGVEYRPIEKLEIAVKREQNLTDSDPTYPNQTTISANYAIDSNTKLFFTQRLASAPISPIGDVIGTGFAATGSRNETAFGIETKLGRIGALNGRYQLENGINGTDSFAVIGLQNRVPLNKEVALELGFERGFLLTGRGKSFNNVTFGASWMPVEGFRATGRYELRNRNGLGQLFTLGAAGRIGENWTTMARTQFASGNFGGRSSSSTNTTAAAAYRPLNSDRFALLFSFNDRFIKQDAGLINKIQQAATRDRAYTLSSDGLWQANDNLEIYGRFAARFNGNGDATNNYASALTYLGQFRAQQRLSNRLDIAGEARWLAQPQTATTRSSFGAELGFWVLPDLRLGGGYNFTKAIDQTNLQFGGARNFKSGYYFTITTKLSNLFDLFGTSNKGLAASDEEDKSPSTEKSSVGGEK